MLEKARDTAQIYQLLQIVIFQSVDFVEICDNPPAKWAFLLLIDKHYEIVSRLYTHVMWAELLTTTEVFPDSGGNIVLSLWRSDSPIHFSYCTEGASFYIFISFLGLFGVCTN